VFQVSAAELVIGAAAGKGEKHHYIPVFYSREWAGPDGRLCEYSRPFKEVKPRWTHPDGTGYVRGLYTAPKNDPCVVEHIERNFFRIADDGAARVAQRLRVGAPIDWFSLDRSSWSRFIISLMLRNPEYVARVGTDIAGFFDPAGRYFETYQEIKQSDDPETYEEYIAEREHHPAGPMSVYAMQGFIDSPLLGERLNQMRWSLITFKYERHTLLTSDRPVIMTDGLIRPHDHLVLPIGPRMLFLATNNIETENRFRAIDADIFMAQVNNRIVSQARKFVYGADNKQVRFVENRLGRRWPSMPLEPLPS
jgi:hypothetical protein